MAAPFARYGSCAVQWLTRFCPGENRCVVYMVGQNAKQSSPVPRAVQFSIVSFAIPTQKLIPSASVLRIRHPVILRLLEFSIHIPTFVCSIQIFEIVEFIPKDPTT